MVNDEDSRQQPGQRAVDDSGEVSRAGEGSHRTCRSLDLWRFAEDVPAESPLYNITRDDDPVPLIRAPPLKELS
jgi:hypothetical protein